MQAQTNSPLRGAVDIASNATHSCALMAAGGVRCWGDNTNGKLGDGSSINRNVATPVVGLQDATGLSAGTWHSCAATRGGARCWGDNDWVQLGNGDVDAYDDGVESNELTPVGVVGLGAGALGVAASGRHSCAVTAAGALVCWGTENIGELGNGDQDNFGPNVWYAAPQPVGGLGSGVIQVSSYWKHSCALTGAGDVYCWGENVAGKLGDGSTDNRYVATPVNGLGGSAVSIAVGEHHSCAAMATGIVKCWGANDFGQLGIGAFDGNDHPSPETVPGLSSIIRVAAGGDNSCALTDMGALTCWGRNDWGQLGNGDDNYDHQSAPVAVSGLGSGVVAMSLGGSGSGASLPRAHSCAVLDGGEARCWGYGNHGQLGDGLFIPGGIGNRYHNTPQVVLTPSVAVDLQLLIKRQPVSSRPGIDKRTTGGEPPRCYDITAANLGDDMITAVSLNIPAPAGLSGVSWDCAAPSGCTPDSGSGALSTQFDLAGGESALASLCGNVDAGAAFVDVAASVSTSSAGGHGTSDLLIETANGIGVSKNGFE
ncbi:MAG: hypothetical protein R3F22_10750 [Lysobacteraceae bacterium]